MIGTRIKRLRLARGLTLEALAAALGGLVTKQAISKYETGKDVPSAPVVAKLAGVLGVKVAELWAEPEVEIELIAYRAQKRLGVTERERVENVVADALERRVRLQDLTQQKAAVDLPLRKLQVKSVEAAEDAAAELRSRWRLGVDPIASVTGVLEDHLIHVVEIEAPRQFDGISAVARQGGDVRAAAVVSRLGVPGERQRLNLAHELAHLVMNLGPNVDEEKAAFRFGASFLAPAEVMYREVGRSRGFIAPAELLLLKKSLGISVQAILCRLKDLKVISEGYHRSWCVEINRLGWRTKEPGEMPCESPQWLQRSILRAVAENVLTKDEAERMFGAAVDGVEPLTLIERKAFMRLPLEERRQLMAEQAEKLEEYYKDVVARGEVDVADTD